MWKTQVTRTQETTTGTSTSGTVTQSGAIEKHSLCEQSCFHTSVPAALCFHTSVFLQSYISTPVFLQPYVSSPQCSCSHMFPHLSIPSALCFHTSMFLQPCVPSMFPQPHVFWTQMFLSVDTHGLDTDCWSNSQWLGTTTNTKGYTCSNSYKIRQEIWQQTQILQMCFVIVAAVSKGLEHWGEGA